MHVIAAKAVSFLEAQSEEFVLYQAQVIANAKTMAETFISRDLRLFLAVRIIIYYCSI